MIWTYKSWRVTFLEEWHLGHNWKKEVPTSCWHHQSSSSPLKPSRCSSVSSILGLGLKTTSGHWATHGAWSPCKRQSLPPEACSIYNGGHAALHKVIFIFFQLIPHIFFPRCCIHQYLCPNWLQIIDPCSLWNCSFCICRYCVSPQSSVSLHRAHPQPFLS